MVERHVRARTGATLRTHQHRTVANYLLLRELAPELPFIATLQGQSVADYQRCADLYERHGVDLAALPRVGVGSICRRSHSGEVEQIVRSLAGRGLRLHTFGAKVLGLSRYADAVCSSDSLALEFPGAPRARLFSQPPQRIQLRPLRLGLAHQASRIPLSYRHRRQR